MGTSDVTATAVQNSGQWIIEEQPTQTMDTLVKFLSMGGPINLAWHPCSFG